MEIRIDRRSRTPLHRQISQAIRGLILSDTLPPNFRLPPERTLARSLGVNRTTVMSAYADLKAEALVTGRVGDGTRVAPRSRELPPAPREVIALRWAERLRTVESAEDERLRRLMQLAERAETIVLAAGFPALDLMPVEAMRASARAVLSSAGASALAYAPAEGLSGFREALAGLMSTRGAAVDPDEILVTSGSHQALDLVTRLLVGPGDTVVVEEPTYIGALQVFRAAGARIVPVAMDGEGLRTDHLEAVLARVAPRFIYTLPTFQNPSGHVMTLARRERLLDLACRHRVPVVEDDIYGDLWYGAPPPPALKALDRGGHVLYTSSFSKVLAPGLRLGWIAAPRALQRRLVQAKQGCDLQAPTLSQQLVEPLLRDGRYARHADGVRAAYAVRRDAMAAALARHARTWAQWETPQGGFYFWLRITAPVPADALAAEAAEQGVSILPGSACLSADVADTFVRLSFSFAAPAEIEEGIRRLGRAVQRLSTRAHTDARHVPSTRPVV